MRAPGATISAQAESAARQLRAVIQVFEPTIRCSLACLRRGRNVIYDCFLFSTEFEVLGLRLADSTCQANEN